MLPENMSSLDDMDMERSSTPSSLFMMLVMLFMMPMSSCPVMRKVVSYLDSSDLPSQRAFNILYPNFSDSSGALGQSVRCIFMNMNEFQDSDGFEPAEYAQEELPFK